MRLNYHTLGIALLSCSLLSLLQAQSDVPAKVLFVGNSYTYFWNLPQSVAAMAESRGVAMATRQSTSGGTNLGQHWRGEKGLASLPLIRSGGFDAVIIQDHSLRPTEHPDSLSLYGQRFGAEVIAAGARAYVYLTWARAWDPYMQADITARYRELAASIGATVIPVGPAWARARELRPELELYHPDGHHPSPTGAYLTACVFYGVLTGQSPIGLPARLTTTDRDGELLYINIQTEEDALFCQKVAAETIQRFTD